MAHQNDRGDGDLAVPEMFHRRQLFVVQTSFRNRTLNPLNNWPQIFLAAKNHAKRQIKTEISHNRQPFAAGKWRVRNQTRKLLSASDEP